MGNRTDFLHNFMRAVLNALKGMTTQIIDLAFFGFAKI
jgi:hypothetical protein